MKPLSSYSLSILFSFFFSSLPSFFSVNYVFLWLQHSGEEIQSKEHDFEGTTADFGKLLFLASISSRISSANVLCSLSPTDEDIEMAGEGPTAATTTGEAAVRESSEESTGKDLDVVITVGEAVVGMPSQGRAVPSTVHDAHHDKELPGMITLNCSYE